MGLRRAKQETGRQRRREEIIDRAEPIKAPLSSYGCVVFVNAQNTKIAQMNRSILNTLFDFNRVHRFAISVNILGPPVVDPKWND